MTLAILAFLSLIGIGIAANEKRIAKEQAEWKQDWEVRQKLWEMGDRRR
jgi:hypothetical protein